MYCGVAPSRQTAPVSLISVAAPAVTIILACASDTRKHHAVSLWRGVDQDDNITGILIRHRQIRLSISIEAANSHQDWLTSRRMVYRRLEVAIAAAEQDRDAK